MRESQEHTRGGLRLYEVRTFLPILVPTFLPFSFFFPGNPHTEWATATNLCVINLEKN